MSASFTSQETSVGLSPGGHHELPPAPAGGGSDQGNSATSARLGLSPADRFDEKSAIGNRILHLSQEPGVSDFYVTPWEPLVYRKNGILYTDSVVFQPQTEFRVVPGTVDYALEIGNRRYRASRMVTRGRFRWVMRLLPDHIPTPAEIMLPGAALKAFMEADHGLFLICGATGSGKSTSIASMVMARASQRREHVITFEDPIEYLYPRELPSLISQREVGSDEPDFTHSLRAALRQAPDVIVVGEIRDGETAEIALQASETGHVVVATMHTSTAAQTAQRYLKLIPSERFENALLSFADSVQLIMCQKLLFDQNRDRRFPVQEVLLPYDAVTGMIRRADFKRLEHELETGTSKGMQNFDYSLQLREYEGWAPVSERPTGFSDQEIADYFTQNKLSQHVL